MTLKNLNMNWGIISSNVSPYIVKIETPSGHGTGFLCLYNDNRSLCGIATALHVVGHDDKWQRPIKLNHHSSNKTHFLRESNRIIFSNCETDSAIILFPTSSIPFPEGLIPLLPLKEPLGIGNEVGWFGFPSIAPYTLCFFSGRISAKQNSGKAYLIDGVAINGVSGGPVVSYTDTGKVQIIGFISAYSANRFGSDTLPGLSIAHDVSYFHNIIHKINSIDEAREKKQQIEELSKHIELEKF
ncbi:MAG: trypsin-like peptidase domain-containing protein [Deltaproteobacteria bacterium]|nr:trypsin-like peptidase domain-containing protein [Deltaproteobacteria bacterium]